MEKIIKNVIKFFIFISIASLPFVTMTQLIGIDTFLDSFENPEYYICLQNKENSLGLGTKNGEYIIIQKSSHPGFSIEKSDSVIYCKNDGEITCNKILQINNIGAIRSYHTTEENDIKGKPIYEPQIVGKVINIIDGNIWNSISIKIWETSISSLNIRALLADN